VRHALSPQLDWNAGLSYFGFRPHRIHAMRFSLCSFTVLALACSPGTDQRLSDTQIAAIRGELEQAMRDAYDLTKPNVPERMLSLYPKSGRVVSSTGGRVVTSRDSLESGIRYFWNSVGVNMRQPRWVWDTFYVDVLSPTTAVVTATYSIPHRNPQNQPHVLGGAMTAVFERRDGRWSIIQEHLSDAPARDSSASMGAHDDH
jgi:hypothetical protein